MPEVEVNKEALQAAMAAAEEAGRPESHELTLSNGIVLKTKPVALYLVQNAVAKLEEPKPPKVDIGKEREEVNPDDPGYLEAKEKYETATIEAALDIALVAGTEIVSIPEGAYKLDDDGWLGPLEFLGIEVDPRPMGRYLTWLRYHAIATAGDIAMVTGAMLTSLGLKEEEVGRAAASFRGGAVRGKDNGAPPADPGHGDNVRPAASRPRSQSRRKRGG